MKTITRTTPILSVIAWLALHGSETLSCEINGETLRRRTAVEIQTELGMIGIKVDLRHAPRTGCNFLKYVVAGAYNGAVFGRTVRADNQIGTKIPIGVIQAYPNAKANGEAFGPLTLETTRDTGLHHRDGTVSMARGGADDATSQFFVCIGDQPELDFGGRRNPDGHGFAAFAQVVRGMDIVRRIQASPAQGEDLKPPILIRSARISSK